MSTKTHMPLPLEGAAEAELQSYKKHQRELTVRKADVLGVQFGRWTVIKQNRTKCDCICACGKQASVSTSTLRLKKSLSCGCLRLELLSLRSFKHGYDKSYSTYNIWCAMRYRCFNPKNKAYPAYGGRGIGIDASWDSFPNFLKDMGERPSKAHSIERIDNAKGYSQSNCRWATSLEQNNNRRDNTHLVWEGVKLTIAQTARRFGLTPSVLRSRLHSGWPLQKALFTPPLK